MIGAVVKRVNDSFCRKTKKSPLPRMGECKGESVGSSQVMFEG